MNSILLDSSGHEENWKLEGVKELQFKDNSCTKEINKILKNSIHYKNKLLVLKESTSQNKCLKLKLKF